MDWLDRYIAWYERNEGNRKFNAVCLIAIFAIALFISYSFIVGFLNTPPGKW